MTAKSPPRTAILLSSMLPPPSETMPERSSTMPTLSAPIAEMTAYALPMPALCHARSRRGNRRGPCYDAGMGLQVFGTRKCPDTRKAERFLKERGVAYQFIDLADKGISPGELRAVAAATP